MLKTKGEGFLYWLRNLVFPSGKDEVVVETLESTNCKTEWSDEVIRFVLISDTHMLHRNLELPPGDILIHAGDFSNRGKEDEIKEFDAWLGELEYKHKVVVPGNHDTGTDGKALLKDRKQREKEGETLEEAVLENATLLSNKMVEVEGLRVFGFPFTLDKWGLSWWAHGVEGEVEMENMLEEFNKMSENDGGVDILVTHSPPHGVGDTNSLGLRCGSHTLRSLLQVDDSQQPGLWVFGHIHKCGGQAYRVSGGAGHCKTVLVNAASADSADDITRKGVRGPVVVDMDRNTKKIIGFNNSL